MAITSVTPSFKGLAVIQDLIEECADKAYALALEGHDHVRWSAEQKVRLEYSAASAWQYVCIVGLMAFYGDSLLQALENAHDYLSQKQADPQTESTLGFNYWVNE